jgi:hypothetical protein
MEFKDGVMVSCRSTAGFSFQVWLNGARSDDDAAVKLWTHNGQRGGAGRIEMQNVHMYPLLRSIGFHAACDGSVGALDEPVCCSVRFLVEMLAYNVTAFAVVGAMRPTPGVAEVGWPALLPLSPWRPRVVTAGAGGVPRIIGFAQQQQQQQQPRAGVACARRQLAVRASCGGTLLLECGAASDAWLLECAASDGSGRLPRLPHAPPLLTSSALAARGVAAGGRLELADERADVPAVLIALMTALSPGCRPPRRALGAARAEQVLAFALRPDMLLAPCAPAAFGAVLRHLLQPPEAGADADAARARDERAYRFVAERGAELLLAGVATEAGLSDALQPLLGRTTRVPAGLSLDELLFLARVSPPLGHLLAAWTWHTDGGAPPAPAESLRQLRIAADAAKRRERIGRKRLFGCDGKRRRRGNAKDASADEVERLLEQLLSYQNDNKCRLMRSWYDAYVGKQQSPP